MDIARVLLELIPVFVLQNVKLERCNVIDFLKISYIND